MWWWVAAVVILGVLATAVPVAAQEPTAPSDQPFPATRVEVVPGPGSTVRLGEGIHPGVMAVTGYRSGVAVVETVDLEQYLLGIREVPFSWHPQALRAQVVAARTYLAWTLSRGRSRTAAAYGYDICATAACQVYAGLAGVRGPGGERWREAVEATAGEILLWEGRPAQALYSSTTGGRTRAASDVYGSHIPYLQAVRSPGEESPFTTWWYDLTPEEMELLLTAAGVIEPPLHDIWTEVRRDGEGPWEVVVVSAAGTARIPTWELRGRIHRVVGEVLPDKLPPTRLDGRRYPQALMSPSYTIRRTEVVTVVDGRVETRPVYRVTGRGWGHLVGMSQYGAQAMAEAGADYREILAHYYGGLLPQPAGEWLPQQVRVGLVTGADSVELQPLGPVTVLADGQPVASAVLGTWRFQAAPGGGLVAQPPAGLGQPPRWGGWRVGVAAGMVTELRVRLSAPAEWRVLVQRPGGGRAASEWRVADAGTVTIPAGELPAPLLAGRTTLVWVEARSPQGSDSSRIGISLGG